MRVIARDAVADAQLREDLRDALGAEKVADLIAKGSRLDPRAMYAIVEDALERIRSAPRRTCR
jgi:hypothetical protein